MIEFFTLLTDIGLSKLANATINGIAVDLKSIAIGDGSGDYYEPASSQTELENEVFRADLNALIIDPADSKRFSAQIIIPESSGGYTIREAGLFDSDGDLIAVAKVPATFKPDNDSGAGAQIYFKILIECSEKANVTISITPSDIFITQEVLDVHLFNKTNPHAVTKAQVGLGKANDTSDEDKPISKAMQATLDMHTNNKTNPHAVTKAQVGLGNVDNERQYSVSNPPPVTSVAGKTGAVTLTADDISGIVPIDKGGTGNSTGTSQYTEGMKFSNTNRKYKFQDLSIASPTDCMTFGTSGIGYTPLSVLKTALNLNKVTNLADSDRNVKYAATAGSAAASDVSAWAKQATKPIYNSNEIAFNDNQTFQQKYDLGILRGQKGDVGATGSQGIQGIKGNTGAIGPQGAQGNMGPAGSSDITKRVVFHTQNQLASYFIPAGRWYIIYFGWYASLVNVNSFYTNTGGEQIPTPPPSSANFVICLGM